MIFNRATMLGSDWPRHTISLVKLRVSHPTHSCTCSRHDLLLDAAGRDSPGTLRCSPGAGPYPQGVPRHPASTLTAIALGRLVAHVSL